MGGKCVQRRKQGRKRSMLIVWWLFQTHRVSETGQREMHLEKLLELYFLRRLPGGLGDMPKDISFCFSLQQGSDTIRKCFEQEVRL